MHLPMLIYSGQNNDRNRFFNFLCGQGKSRSKAIQYEDPHVHNFFFLKHGLVSLEEDSQNDTTNDLLSSCIFIFTLESLLSEH